MLIGKNELLWVVEKYVKVAKKVEQGWVGGKYLEKIGNPIQ